MRLGITRFRTALAALAATGLTIVLVGVTVVTGAFGGIEGAASHLADTLSLDRDHYKARMTGPATRTARVAGLTSWSR